MVDVKSINALLCERDIEGLIELGAPLDEYESEAKIIAEAVSDLTVEQRTEENILAIVTVVWAKYFELSPNELELRLPNLKDLAAQIAR